MTTVLDRDALYYPRIHIRDPHWLKQTLLCFPQVRRMVPIGFPLQDPPEVHEFRKLRGPRDEPLLSEEDVYGFAVYEAQFRLAERLKVQPEERLRRFTRDATQRRFGRVDSFQIHRGKLMDVLHFLEPQGYAWAPSTGDRSEWVALHPDLGTAIMSFIAIAIAEAKGLDIVTPSQYAHLALATRDENLVFEEMMRGWGPARLHTKRDISDKVDDLVQVVMRSCFDVTRLTPRQIADLVNDGKDLRTFKNALVPIAESIPDVTDEQERRKRFDEAAGEVLAKWRMYRKSLPRFAVDAIMNVSKVKPPDVFTTISGVFSSHFVVGVEGSLMVGFLVHAGLSVYRDWKERVNSPMRYLTRVEKAGAVLTISR